MKTRYWVLLIAAGALISFLLGFFLLRNAAPSDTAQIYSQGVLIQSVSLLRNQVFTVTTAQGGSNQIQVRDGKISVISASCPDHICMLQGARSGGAPIICLPNRLEIRFSGSAQPDLSIG